MTMAGIYIHIPFCTKRCIYCGFYSTTQTELMDRYTAAVCKELTERKEYIDNHIKTIYFGGGTPSLLNSGQIERIFQTIMENYRTDGLQEVTFECNPDDITCDFLQSIARTPINRISMGIQSFNDDILGFIRRRHNSEQAVNAVKLCHEAGFNNISIDLIYGIPGQTVNIFREDIEKAIALNVSHISSYHLSYEEETPIWHLLQNKKITAIEEDSSVSMYNLLCDSLRKSGFKHYEISNFAKEGYESKHNSSYWNGTPYLGIGAGAHSFNGVSRRWNPDNITQYIGGIESNKPVFEEEFLTDADRYNEIIMLGLRKSDGIDLTKFNSYIGEDLFSHFMQDAEPHIKNGSLIMEKDRIRFTEDGLFTSDNIISSLFLLQ